MMSLATLGRCITISIVTVKMERVGVMLDDLKSLLEQSAVRVNTLSTMARLANNSLVEKFFMESLTLKLPQYERDGSVVSQTEMLQSYIYTCCFWGSRDVLKRIIDLTAEHHLNIDLNAQNPGTLWTPLHAATFQEHGPIVMLLLECGANPGLRDADGWTPIHFASVSDKIWSHFASRGIPRVPFQVLLDKEMITKLPDQSRNGSASSPIQGLELQTDYGRTSSGMTSYNGSAVSVAAARNGDVLASDNNPPTPYSGLQRRTNFMY